MALSFLWHDYETFGKNPHTARPAQFAAIRTDENLQAIGQPINILCAPSPDFLPEPEACLIHGITPQTCLTNGLPEAAFTQKIFQALNTQGTVSVGYNSIRYDDEISRFLFWRNLRDPYSHGWANDCARWDLLDVMRTAYALRPDGIQWPVMDGHVSFRLENLCAANGLIHTAAHDALSDVGATLELARVLRRAQPKLFDFCFALRDKQKVWDQLNFQKNSEFDLTTASMFLHVSGQFGVERGNLALMALVGKHPTNPNEVIAWDLSFDPTELADLSVEQIRARLFIKTENLPRNASGVTLTRLPIKTIHANRSPVVIQKIQTLTIAQAQRWAIDFAKCEQHLKILQQMGARGVNLTSIWHGVFGAFNDLADDEADDFTRNENIDADVALYRGFIGNGDRNKLTQFHALPAAKQAKASIQFDDKRLTELFSRYRARNFYDELTEDEQANWHAHCQAQRDTVIDDYLSEIERLSEQLTTESNQQTIEKKTAILEALMEYAESL